MSELNLLDYIKPKELVDFYSKIQNLFPVCTKCQKPVFLKNIKENKIVKIKIDCPFCNHSESLILNDYIKQLEQLIPEKKFCVEHKDKLSFGFCQDCDKWQCKECFIKHIPENHMTYQSQFKIRPTCPEHPNEQASFYNTKTNIYLCNKCNFKPLLEQLTNAYFYNLRDDSILSHCYRCLYYDFIITEAKKDLYKLDKLITKIFKDDSKLASEKSEKINKAFDLINNNINEVRFNNLFIANSYLKSMPNYHSFKNIKNNMGENHETFWSFNDMIYEIEDKEKDMTKETLLELIDKFSDICENNITTGVHSKLSENNMFDFIDESDLKVKEIQSCKIEHENVSHGFLLEKNKSFLIYGRDYFTIYDSNTFKIIQEEIFNDDTISYVNIVDNKRFLVSFRKHYCFYELKDNNKYISTKKVKLQEVNLDEFKKQMGIETIDKKKDEKSKKKKSDDNDNDDNEEKDKKDEDDSDDDYDNNSSEKGDFDPKDINSDMSAITLLKDGKNVACAQGSLISIREFETGKLIKALFNKESEGGFEILFTYKNFLVSCCSCNRLCFWDMDSFELKANLDAEISSPTSYLILENEIMITGGSSIGYQVILDELKVDGNFSGNFMLLHGFVQINEDEILIATKDYSTSSNNFYLLNLFSMEPELHMKNIHSDICEGCIKIDDKRFVTVSSDCTFKVWEIKEEKEDEDED